MEAQGLIMIILVGAIAGWLAGLIMKGKGMGFIINALLGIVGASVGNYLFSLIGFSIAGGLIGTIFTSTTGAVVLLFIIGVLRKSQ
ncbi:MAG: GlsB/YeaQ/YmgE family stress response membrane protein [gamma proteobacterium symbiont of Taylorina sp.]|nr:GlsB/YeaQ/YmgE family stress response membrane protein [gamma proteobacterium symbiont of Taylorina sp.]